MGGELRVSSIFPSYGSLRRCRPLLCRVPRTGSPTSSLLLRHSDFCAPPGRSASRSASRFRFSPAARRSPRFLGNPCIRAPFFDPGEEHAGQRPRAFGPALNLLSVAFRERSAGHIESFSLLHRDPLSPGLSWRKNSETCRSWDGKAARGRTYEGTSGPCSRRRNGLVPPRVMGA